MINDCKPEPGIIRDYFKLTDAQLEANVLRGYEEGEITEEEQLLEGFQAMIDDGLVWQLQGCYGRTAAALIDQGLCHKTS